MRSTNRRRTVLTAAAAITVMYMGGAAFGQTLYWDTNNATTGSSNPTSPGTWSATNTNWSTSTAGTVATGTWVSGDIADFSAGTNATGAYTVAVSGAQTLSGIVFEEGQVTLGTTGASGWALNFGANPVNITIKDAGKNQIWVPINADPGVNMTFTFQGGNATMLLAGDTANGNNYLSGFSGNVYAINSNTTKNGANMPALAMTQPLATATQTFNLDQFIQLTGDNQQTNNGHTTSMVYSIPNPIVLNYNGVVGAAGAHIANGIGAGNGTNSTSIYGNAAFVAGVQRIVTYSGPISSNATTGAITDLYVQGSRGTTVLSSASNTYNGDTYVAVANTNGLFQMGVDDAMPASSVLYFGLPGSTGAVGPMDLAGHSIHIAGLGTQTTQTATNGTGGVDNGNIYNTSLTGSPSPVTITIAGAANTTYKGDIGDTNLNVNPFNDQSPYVTGSAAGNNATQVVTTGTNISLVVNGPGTLTLAPAANQLNGNEYTGTTTVNGGGLSFGRLTTYTAGNTPGSQNTITGGGSVQVNGGATLSSVPTAFGNTPTYAGGASGMITLATGATLSPGGTGAAGLLSTNNMTVNQGVNLNFEFGSSAAAFDSVYLQGGLTLDPSGGSTVNLGLANGVAFVIPGTYTLMNAGGSISWGAGVTLGSMPTIPGESFSLAPDTAAKTGNMIQVVVTGNVFRWDPNGQGAATGVVTENGGTWTDVSAGGTQTFVNYNNNTEAAWDNTAQHDVLIGADITGGGGTITLGSDIVVNGKVIFGPIFQGFNYSIAGNGHTLTIRDGVNVNNTAASSTTPSAEIAAPVVLSADQQWSVDSGQFLNVTGPVTGNFVMTKTGSGVAAFNSAGGSIGGLAANGGTVLLGAVDALGATAPITLNGGAVQWTVDGTAANPIALGASGGSIGATSASPTSGPHNIVLTGNVTGGNPLTVIGTGNTTFNGNITAGTFAVSTSTAAAGGNVVLNGNNTLGAISVTGGGTTTLNGTNTITATTTPTVTISNGTLVAASPAALSSGTLPMIGFTPTNTTVIPTLSIAGFTTLPNNINIGTNGSANSGISDTVPLVISGNINGAGNLHLTGPEFTLSGNNSNTNSIAFDTPGMTVHAGSATAFGVATLAISADSTVDTPVDVSTNAIRSSITGAPHTLTKTGAGTLTITGSASVATTAGSAIVINAGAVVMKNNLSLGGNTTSNTNLNITVNNNATLVTAWTSGTVRTSGSVTLNGGTVSRPSITDVNGTSVNSETAFTAASAADVWTITGNSRIWNQAILNANANNILGITNPVVVTTGAVLTVQTDNTFGFGGNDAVNFRGPTVVTGTGNNAYMDFVIRAGGTVRQVGPGEMRFGRVGSQGIPIIGQGTPGSEALLQLGADTWMTDVQGNASQIVTQFQVNGSGGAGLRIEAPMSAAYVDPSTSPPASQAIGTTGLFGTDPYAGQTGHTNGNVFTVLSQNRAAAISNGYNDGTTTFAPSGTLTLAANDAGGATGVVDAGPAAPIGVGLALDNTATSGGSLVFRLDGQATNGSRLLNFSNGVTVERTNPSGGTVKGQLKSNTHLASLVLSSTTFDLVDHALAVESVGSIGSYLTSHTLYSSTVDADTNAITTIAVVHGSDLGGLTSLNGIVGITPATTIYAPAYYGDINLDGRINGDDYSLMDRSFAMGLAPNWIDGDFNNDGLVNSGDYFLMDRAFGISNGGTLAPELLSQREAEFGAGYVQSLVTSVPEPTAIGLLGLAVPVMARRRRM